MTKDKTEPHGTASRRAALRLLDAVLRKGLPLEAALDGATRELDRADDRAFAHAIAAETLRRLPDLDALIDSATQKPLPYDAKARFALRIALSQALALETPAHAAIATVLPLVDGGPRKLVHGVFGALMRKQATLPALPTLPKPVAARWRGNWGLATAEAARALIAAPPPIDLALKKVEATAEWAERLGGISLAPGHVRIARSAGISTLPGFAEGDWWVQDIAASLPARLLGEGEGRHLLDLCAAPGGKTLRLAAAGWRVTALDLSEPRLVRLQENLARTGLSAETIAADLTLWAPEEAADAVLLDAPCSATGIFRRHPDVLHRVRERAIGELAEQQRAMLLRAADWVKPGGTLVYAVCSLEPREGEAVADALIEARPDYALLPVENAELPDGLTPDRSGRVRVLPGMLADQGGADGFFVARFRRKG
ncbi:RsmB/NOP family class I SAM-dependent RNA methyltransferase [Flavisphingomonas formosensis]|uniref:RsmB/NOP family class I SAM-dependent RNA methyltransferase n=1 Tax=Flavisphingomonas formosensis TaxID=861534 RepID=UPI0012F73F64|nr:RsmB/NOP family class I SAM-dependent RNA methyltransferase [Sphingomonas formosensis]